MMIWFKIQASFCQWYNQPKNTVAQFKSGQKWQINNQTTLTKAVYKFSFIPDYLLLQPDVERVNVWLRLQ